MVFVGKVTPGCVGVGRFAAKIGRFRINPAGEEKVPLRFVQYAPVTNPNDLINWQRIASGEVQVATDSVLKLDPTLVRAFTLPENGVPGALLTKKEQLSDEVLKTMRQMVPAFDQSPSWLVILPYLSENGKNAAGFTLTAAGAGPQEVQDFTRDLHENIQLFKKGGNNVLFVNPYHLEQLKTS